MSAAVDDGQRLSPVQLGARLRQAREQAGLDQAALAAQTRIPQRHLNSIEAGDFASLPGRTYALGFGRAYARAVGLPEAEFADTLREAMDEAQIGPPRPAAGIDVEDPAKVPSARTAWIAAAAGVALLLAGFGIWRTAFFPGADLPAGGASPIGQASAPAGASAAGTRPAAGPPSAPATGPVIFTATEDGIWVKFYDGAGDQLLQKQMARGEQYTIPADAQEPQIWTGRPDAFRITVAGRPVPPLGTAETAIKDVPVSAEALLARASSPAPAALPPMTPGDEAAAGASTADPQNAG